MTNSDSFFTCSICPRNCNASRTNYQGTGFCHAPSEYKIARYSLHKWEEPFISGENGSGTIFFSGCNLGCIYCQNKEIARSMKGQVISNTDLINIMLHLEREGAHNINLVTPSHYIHLLPKTLEEAKKKDLSIPIVYNTSSYENVDSLKSLDGLIDIYLADFKYLHYETSAKYSHSKDYPEIAMKAIKEMFRQTGNCVIDNRTNMLKSGTVIRHLVLPLNTSESCEIIKYIFNLYGNSVYISIMNQYTPPSTSLIYPELNRKLTKREYNKVVDYAINLGIQNCFIQEGDTAKDSFIPEFCNEINIPTN